MPAQQGVGRGDRGDVPQGRTAHSIRARGEASAIFVGQTQPTPAELAPQRPVLFDQVSDRPRSRRSNQPVSTSNTIWSAEASITSRSSYHWQDFEPSQVVGQVVEQYAIV
jgi:hypothetical protein